MFKEKGRDGSVGKGPVAQDNLWSIHRTHINVGGEYRLRKAALWPLRVQRSVCTHKHVSCIHNDNKNFHNSSTGNIV